ncbi:hypothetical protein LTR70_007724 [Exophiala xenobiotica]|uniref:Uncharacterized protein n=1 Tax=Lithohypha guttulata TaxID=1690604 RepID=A0ABR0K5A2_9EURO|nr:hypothetical protein LTR24_006717 [Lithohypha guttulata]KAK5313207.1 hypothetical protein LTR70_007724 [Exophiala xenobiotica]
MTKMNIVILILLLRSRARNYHSTLQGLSQTVGLGELIEDEDEGESNQHQEQDLKQAQRPADPSGSNSPLLYHHDSLSSSSFPPGAPKAAGEPYTRALIAGRLTTENTTWLDTYLPTDPTLTPFIYVVNDQTAPLHTPRNKGHEAMVYLTYILDQYDSLTLPDINIFMHPHSIAWHNPELLNHDATEALKRLSSERVMRHGYMNLRCHWDPGCPERIHPGTSYRDNLKREEIALAGAWAEMFPDDPIPSVVAAPCCAQFAVSRDRIRSIPKAHYARYRDWLLRTKETDWISGRVFEYLWHKIFTGQDTLCPDTRSCYCDGYGVCFSTPETFELWFDNHHWWRKAIKELEVWEERARTIDGVSRDYKKIEGMRLDVPVPGRNWELKREIDERFQLLARVRVEALRNGTDPEVRARVAGRLWGVGEGY